MFKLFCLLFVGLFIVLSFAEAGAAHELKVEHPATGQPGVPFDVTVTLVDAYGNPVGAGSDRVYIAVDRLGQQTLLMTNGVVTFHNIKSQFKQGACTIVCSDPVKNLNKTTYMKQAP